MGLAALPHVPLMHESRKENRITKRYLDLTDKEFSHYNVKATDEDKDFTKKIENLMSSAPDTNMLTRFLHLNIYVPLARPFMHRHGPCKILSIDGEFSYL